MTQRQGIITCVPKEGKPKHLIKNWRPISLLNTAYKIASACIANRIKRVLPKLIHTDQRGFMKGRYIGENIRLLYDMLVYTQYEKIPGLLLLVDFEKAFDSISWKFIDKVLDFVNFGPDIKKWVSAFYYDILTCVSVNGSYSAWFNICRGVRQGDPLSPYLYLLCAEILSNMLRENENIKGVKVRDGEIMLSQFADDTALCLDGSEKSFIEAVRILNVFASMSGLKINFNKTQVIWIGSRKNCQIRYMRDMNFCWDPGTFRYLGIVFSVDTGNIVHLNYLGRMAEIRKLLNTWGKRQLTPFGKITVLKTLAVSKLTYLFMNIPDPSDAFIKELDCMFFNFLWNGKQGKIKKKCACQSYQTGGLKMLNASLFLSAMKISWLRRVFVTESSLSKFIHCLYPDLEKLQQLGAEFANTLLLAVHNPFWHDVLKHFKNLSLKCTPIDISDFNAECIFYNKNILIGKHTVYFKDWLEHGIFQVCHLLNEDGSFFNFEEFRTKFSTLTVNFLKYGGLVESIKKYQNKINVVQEVGYKMSKQKPVRIIFEGNKSVQSYLAEADSAPAGVVKWNGIFDNLGWKKIFYSCHKTTVDCQLKWFQLRLIYRALPTNRYLFLRKIIESANCSICGNDEETVRHLMWHCQHVNKFWQDLQELIVTRCSHVTSFRFSELLVLFGVQENMYTDKALDFIILLAKFYIYKCKWNFSRPTVKIFLNFLKYRYRMEKYKGDIVLFDNIW